ncbi:tetratricopeptide repeat protein [Poriferisphaera sp. WC338]|uniref:tetratricopeptide repeat protein n=1 Tax=Poriferisphaera sp. WC338 TaxID=3425129 RepID=UPI003D81B3B2
MHRLVLIFILMLGLLLSAGCKRKSAIQQQGNTPKAAYVKAVGESGALLAAEKYEEAITALDTFIKSHPGNPSIFYLKGNIYHLAGEYDRALKAFDQAIRLRHEYAEAWLGGGFALLRDGKREDAARYLQRARNGYQQYLKQPEVIRRWQQGDMYREDKQPSEMDKVESKREWEQRADKIAKIKMDARLHVALITALQGYPEAAVTDLQMMAAKHPQEKGQAAFFIDLIRSDRLERVLLDLKVGEGIDAVMVGEGALAEVPAM